MSLPLGIHLGDCVEVLRTFPEASIDAVVTDPPYGIGFMGHEWDQPGIKARRAGTTAPFAGGRPDPRPHVVGAAKLRESDLTRRAEGERDHTKTRERAAAMHAGHYDLTPAAMRAFQEWTTRWASEVLRVLKPGGHLVSFASTRTNHRHVCGIEDAGFEIRDSLVWLFGSGFPKSRDLGEGRGTALKPGHEPIVLARKPFKGSATANVAAHGTGGLNIDACRIAGAVPTMDRQRRSRSRADADGRGRDPPRPRRCPGALTGRPGGLGGLASVRRACTFRTSPPYLAALIQPAVARLPLTPAT